MEIIKWDRFNNNCLTCYFNIADYTCDYKDYCVDGMMHYANKHQIESLIEEAEKKHRENGRLVVCDHAEECNIKNGCECSMPHVFDENCPAKPEYDSEICCKSKCIAYIGEPAKEEEGQEYVVVRDILTSNIAKTDYNPRRFKKLVADMDEHVWDTGIKFSREHVLYKHRHDLKAFGFIEKVVHDPVVSIGDRFKVKSGNIYQFTYCCKNKMWLTLVHSEDLHNNNIGQGYGNCNGVNEPIGFDMCKLSECVGKERLIYFKPVKIKITEVEEGRWKQLNK